ARRGPVCADGGAAVVPAGDAQAVAGPAVASATAGSGWQLVAGAERGPGGPRRGAVPARPVAALRAHAAPGPSGPALKSRTPAGAGSRGAGNVGERAVAVAAGRAGRTGRG